MGCASLVVSSFGNGTTTRVLPPIFHHNLPRMYPESLLDQPLELSCPLCGTDISSWACEVDLILFSNIQYNDSMLNIITYIAKDCTKSR